ncbi:MAG TPA: hypothetical protein VMV86_05370 [Methanosarcinales archaeon]|nr:hypothetical protein [Methanosarcinales archaeon]
MQLVANPNDIRERYYALMFGLSQSMSDLQNMSVVNLNWYYDRYVESLKHGNEENL